MRLLAGQNIPHDAVVALRRQGHDVGWIHEDMPGVEDVAILHLAQTQKRVVLTFDKDFGELAIRHRLSAASGIILLRISAPSAGELASQVVSIIDSRDNWQGHFSVISRNHIRMVPLPLPSS